MKYILKETSRGPMTFVVDNDGKQRLIGRDEWMRGASANQVKRLERLLKARIQPVGEPVPVTPAKRERAKRAKEKTVEEARAVARQAKQDAKDAQRTATRARAVAEKISKLPLNGWYA